MCCGKSRAMFRGAAPNHPPIRPEQGTIAPTQLNHYPGAAFEYIGSSGLTVMGPVTGRQYRFDRPGARVSVDPRDRASIAAIPLLRQAR